MTFRLLVTSLCVSIFMTGCATSKRGAKQDFLIKTQPPGAKVETTIPGGRPVKLSQADYDQIQAGEKAAPELIFLSCEPTPCGFKLPRKDGYVSQIYKIDHFHRKVIAKEVEKEVKRNMAIGGAGAAALGATTAAIGVQAASLGTATASTGTMAAGAAIAIVPVVGIGLISMGVDSSTGANYDYWPNPVMGDLIEVSPNADNANAKTYADFDAMRRARIIRPYPTAAERKAERKAIEADRETRLANNRLFKDYVKNPPPERLAKPQSQRAQRRAEKRAKREMERQKTEVSALKD